MQYKQKCDIVQEFFSQGYLRWSCLVCFRLVEKEGPDRLIRAYEFVLDGVVKGSKKSGIVRCH